MIINDPPSPPEPIYPKGDKIYYRKSHGLHPTFKWKKPDSWGWVSTGVNHEYVVKSLTKEKSVKSDEDEVVYAWEGDFGYKSDVFTYRWKVGAKSSSELKTVWSGEMEYKVCPVDDISSFTLKSPADKVTLNSKNVEFTWNAPKWSIPWCADEKLYGYVFTLWKKNSGKNVKNESVSENKISVSDLEEDDYMWNVEAYGPAGIKSNPGSGWSFSICIDKKPTVPLNLRIEGGSSVVCTSGTKVNVGVLWEEPSEAGKTCANGGAILNYEVKVAEEEPIQLSNHWHSMELTCEDTTGNVNVKACKGGQCGPEASTGFSVCAQELPDEPTVSDHSGSHCRKKTNVTWTHSGKWGKLCNTEKAAVSKRFDLKFTKSGADDVETSVEGEDGSKTYSTEVELAPGTWDLRIVAVTMLTTGSGGVLTSTAATATVVAAEFPVPTSLKNESVDGQLELSWAIDEDIEKCAKEEEVNCTVHYIVDDSTDPESKTLGELNLTMEYSLQSVPEQAQWWVELRNSKGESASSSVVVYSAENYCRPIEPRWSESESVLLEPREGAKVFGSVTFRWNAPATVGQSCQEGGENVRRHVGRDGAAGAEGSGMYYTVSVNNTKYKTSEAWYQSSELARGVTEWFVTFHNGNMSIDTNKRIFCLADEPPSVEAKCTAEIHEGLVLEWEQADCKCDHSFNNCSFFSFLIFNQSRRCAGRLPNTLLR